MFIEVQIGFKMNNFLKFFHHGNNVSGQHILFVYEFIEKYWNLKWFFFIDKNALTNDFFEELHSFIGPQLTNIASEIAEHFTKEGVIGKSLISSSSSTSSGNSNSDETNQTTKYLFLNELNFQHNGTVHLNQKLYQKKRSIPREIMNLLNDLYVQDANTSDSSEIIVKTLSDYWIVKRSTNWRHSFVIFNKNATLLDIADEANKVLETHLNDVFSHI